MGQYFNNLICRGCQKFTRVTLYEGAFQCVDCLGETKRQIINNEKPKKKQKRRPPTTATKIKQAKTTVSGMRLSILDYFEKNPGVVIKSPELVAMFPQYRPKSLMTCISNLVRKKVIYSRLINTTGHRDYAIYSTNEAHVKELQKEETAYKFRQFVRENAPVCTRDLVENIKITQKNISKIHKKWLADSIVIYLLKNQFWYLPAKNSRLEETFIKAYPEAQYVAISCTQNAATREGRKSRLNNARNNRAATL